MTAALRDSGYDAESDFGKQFDRLIEEQCTALETMAILAEREAAKIEGDGPS